jgi:hypothetical protein
MSFDKPVRYDFDPPPSASWTKNTVMSVTECTQESGHRQSIYELSSLWLGLCLYYVTVSWGVGAKKKRGTFGNASNCTEIKTIKIQIDE